MTLPHEYLVRDHHQQLLRDAEDYRRTHSAGASGAVRRPWRRSRPVA